MKVKDFLSILVTTRAYELDLKVQISNSLVDIDSVDIEDDMVVLNVFSDLPIFISPVFGFEAEKLNNSSKPIL
jgi:hypothetical protein